MRILLKILIAAAAVFVFMSVSCGDIRDDRTVKEEKQGPEPVDDGRGNQITGEPSDTIPSEQGHIMIGNVGDFTFDPSEIRTLRDDIFNEGYFSIFDILAHLDDTGIINMEYHFEDDMNTYVIDSINDLESWWYIAYYDGGWPERNVYRMDHYPYKDGTYISVSEADKDQLAEYYRIFQEEIQRKKDNAGRIIIPEVIIHTRTDGAIVFKNVEIMPYDLRSDIFKQGTVTAIDAVMTLGDEGMITYGLNWYESVGTAGLVKDYFVDRINEDASSGRCGFVYEEGSFRFQGFTGNHIHIPSDSRVINSPEYIEFYWICI